MNKGSLHAATPMSRELLPVPTSSARAYGTPGVQLEALSVQRSDPSLGESEVASLEGREEDPVGYTLRLAAQSIAAARQDFFNELASARKKYETMKEQYEQASQFYFDLRGQYEDFLGEYNRISTDIVRGLDEQRQLKETAKIQLGHAHGELLALAAWKTSDPQARDDTIGILQKTIHGKNAKITNLEGELERRGKHAAEAIRGHNAAVAEVGRLNAIIMAHELRAGQLQKEEVAALTAKPDAQEPRPLSRQFTPAKEAMGMRFEEHDNMDSWSTVVNVGEESGEERRRKKPKQHHEW
ncbi:hypothetical protein B0T26DRAFT_680800 [Lasiosphaeria miniovina]|uniref:Uncharacterized protein n=1 Tax=Lasiosphaeria miniovina TaxID=1954250 RepID=A0AA39ZSX2_9PEZI|nr:uncharacterized protein B0T26DRAFT_680800 [Lasiosphaeria miniovina]KAK0703045.1 hypothetical protein B0T26DRAFT_680800 [Lasiosphaeria miniovina]